MLAVGGILQTCLFNKASWPMALREVESWAFCFCGFPLPQNPKYPGLEELIGSSLTVSARIALRAVTGLAKHDDCLEEFNKYVQGPMRDAAVADLGDVTDIPHAVSCNLFLRIVLHSGTFG